MTRKYLQKPEILVIDEISMVRADLLWLCRQILAPQRLWERQALWWCANGFIGDSTNFLPVVGKEEKAFTSTLRKSIFLQLACFSECDMVLLSWKNLPPNKTMTSSDSSTASRNRSCTEGNLAELNSCHQPTFEPNTKWFYISLTSTNALADTPQ